MSTTDPSDNLSFDSHLPSFRNQDELPLHDDQTANFATPVLPSKSAQPELPDDATMASGKQRLEQNSKPSPEPIVEPESSTESAYTDRYERRGELGRGGWGVVDRVLDRQLEREVAVKRITIPEGVSDEVKARFLHEAKITSQLQHPGVVPVHELVVGDDQQSTYYVMKLLEGETLRDHIRIQHQTDSPKDQKTDTAAPNSSHDLLERITPLLERFIDVCNAVAYAHQRGVIHRDLKPANIMVGAFGETIVVDWGLAVRDLGQQPDEVEEQTIPGGGATGPAASLARKPEGFSDTDGTVIGTPAYMSPEQARGEILSIGGSSDIYSLGIVLWEIIVGRHPYRGRPVDEILKDVCSGIRPCIKQQQPLIAKPLIAILEKTLAAKPLDRYDSATELANDVRQFMLGEPVSVHRESAIDRVGRWCRKNRSLVAMITVSTFTLLFASVVSGYLINLSRKAELQAKLAANAAHESAFNRMVESRDAADSWLIDLSGSLEFYPGLGSMRSQLLVDAIEQYEGILATTSSEVDSELRSADPELLSMIDLENVRCHLRLGDLYFLVGESEDSKKHFELADAKLNAIAVDDASAFSGDLNAIQKVDLSDWIQLEKANAAMGLAFHEPERIDSSEFRNLRRWFQLFVPDDDEQMLNEVRSSEAIADFRKKVVSAAIRLELVAYRYKTDEAPVEPTTAKLKRATGWARWLAKFDKKPASRRLYQTAQQTVALYAGQTDQTDTANESWGKLISDSLAWIPQDNPRPDQLQGLAHARLMKLSLGTRDGTAEQEYRSAIGELNRAWSLSDSDSFYRTNLATAEFSLAQTIANSQADELTPARIAEALGLLRRALTTYQELLQEEVSIERLRRLAETHHGLATLMLRSDIESGVAAGDATQHLQSGDLAYQMIQDHGGLEVDDALNWLELLVGFDSKTKRHAKGTGSLKEKRISIVACISGKDLTAAQAIRWRTLQKRSATLIDAE